VEEFHLAFPGVLKDGKPRVLKQNRGNGGIGVWKVTALDRDGIVVRVQHAAPRDDATEEVTLREFMERCSSYFAGAGRLIDQPFASWLAGAWSAMPTFSMARKPTTTTATCCARST
jgi:hypothetical protein